MNFSSDLSTDGKHCFPTWVSWIGRIEINSEVCNAQLSIELSLRLSPVGVLFLVTSKIMEMESFDVILGQLGMYFMTVLIGLFIHGFIVLPTIFYLFTKKNPISYISNMAQAIATAFGTSSSSATLPVAIGCLEERNGIDPRVSRFVMPIGATINMDGTALYEAVAAIFIAQVRDYHLSFGQLAAVRYSPFFAIDIS